MIWWVGLIFLVGSLTVFFPSLAALTYLFVRKPSSLPILASSSIEILIPVFNEEETIEKTLRSVIAAVDACSAQVKISIGIDGSTDGTLKIAQKIAQSGKSISILNRTENRGKWQTLVELVDQSQSAWIICLDSGTIWENDFLVRLVQELQRSRAVGIAPGYLDSRAAFLSRLVWWQERVLKSVENLAGGPIALHGATMIFRTLELKRVVQRLRHMAWLNDDVVLALCLRQEGPILYLGERLLVRDSGVKQGLSDVGRRKRIALGNLQWIKNLYLSQILSLFKSSPSVAVLCLRRIVRILWAYWILLSIFILVMALSGDWKLGLAGVGLSTVLIAVFNRALRDAGWVSLSFPILVFRKQVDSKWS